MPATQMSIKYYEFVSGYGAPLVPRNMISKEETKARKTYYEVAFDNLDRVAQVSKIMEEKLAIRFEYEYDHSGRVSSMKITRDGKTENVDLTTAKQPAISHG